MESTLVRNVEIKARTNKQIKHDAKEIYSSWGLSLSDAINLFLIKSVDVGGLPFEMKKTINHDKLRKNAHIAKLDKNGVAVLPEEWND